MGKSSYHGNSVRLQSSKKHGDLPGNDVPVALEEEERRPHYAGRAFCRAMERQGRHSRLRKHKAG